MQKHQIILQKLRTNSNDYSTGGSPVYAEWIWAFGADAYVVSPSELVDYLRAKTDEMAQIYETITAAPKV